MFAAAPFVALALAAQAMATVYTTSPVGSTTWTAGQQVQISWQDDGSAPSLEQFGDAKVSIYVGNAQQQTLLQSISESVNVATTNSIQFTPDASIGPNGAQYFIRFESLAFKDLNQPQFPALAFSSKFTLSGMSGQFNSSVQAQIDGQSTAPIAGQTSAPAASSTGSVSASVTSKASASSSASSSGSAAKASATENAAIGAKAGWAGLALSALIGVAMF
jgi:hypothetical protein